MKKWKTQRRYQRVWKHGHHQPKGVVIVRFEPGTVNTLFWWSICDKEDQFSKKTGFEIALKRKPVYFKIGSDADTIEATVKSFPSRLQPIVASLIVDLTDYYNGGQNAVKAVVAKQE